MSTPAICDLARAARTALEADRPESVSGVGSSPSIQDGPTRPSDDGAMFLSPNARGPHSVTSGATVRRAALEAAS